MDCQEQATRYTLLCPAHEARNLNLSLAPVFDYPSPEAIAVAVDALVMPHVSWPMKRYLLQPMLANVLLGSRDRQVTFKNLGPVWAAMNEGRTFNTVRTRRSDLKWIGEQILSHSSLSS